MGLLLWELILHIGRDEMTLSFTYCLTRLNTNMKPIMKNLI